MKKTKTIFISRSSDYSGGSGFGFTLRHFVIYPPSISFNDILQVIFLSKKKTISFHLKLFRSKNQVIFFFLSD